MHARAAPREAEISISGEIGVDGLSAQDFRRALDALGRPSLLRVTINSPGGDVSQGFMVFNMLDRHPARKIVTIESVVASMASVIAMVGDEIIMPSDAFMMIHKPTGTSWGTADQLESYSAAVRKMESNIVDAYVARSGADRAEIVALMNRETWLTSDEAVALGLADRVAEPLGVATRAMSLRCPRKITDLYARAYANFNRRIF